MIICAQSKTLLRLPFGQTVPQMLALGRPFPPVPRLVQRISAHRTADCRHDDALCRLRRRAGSSAGLWSRRCCGPIGWPRHQHQLRCQHCERRPGERLVLACNVNSDCSALRWGVLASWCPHTMALLMRGYGRSCPWLSRAAVPVESQHESSVTSREHDVKQRQPNSSRACSQAWALPIEAPRSGEESFFAMTSAVQNMHPSLLLSCY